MNSFRRAVPKDAAPEHVKAKGVKPTTFGGLGIVSSGNKELDNLLGGGITLGTSLVLQSDKLTNFGETLMQYSIAEGVSMFHDVLLLTHDEFLAENIISSLPYNRNLGHQNSAEDMSKTSGEKESGPPTEDEETDAPRSAGKIAWQYDKYICKDSKGPALSSNSLYKSLSSSQFCCSYDLSRRLQSHILKNNAIQTFCCASAPNLQAALDEYYNVVVTFMQSVQERKRRGLSSGVVRIFLPKIECWLSFAGDKDRYSATSTSTIAAFTLRLKHLLRSTRSVLFISVLPEAAPRLLAAKLSGLHDSALSIETFAGREASISHEFHDFMGFFSVTKIQHVGNLVAHVPPGSKFGLKRDRRKLHIEPLHLPPEESRAFGTAGTDAALEKKAERMSGGLAGLGELVYSAGPSKAGPSTSPQAVTAAQVDSTRPLTLAEKLALNRINGAQRGAVSISSFRPKGKEASTPLAPGSACSLGLGGKSDLDF